MKPESVIVETTIGNRRIQIETGKIAQQAGGAVTVRMGDTVVFAAATMSSEPKENTDFFPLTVEYEERMYAGGRIPGSFFRREGRPSDEAILTARLADRPIRPLFPKDLRNEVQIILYSLSSDNENPIDILAVNAASAALTISDIPWEGPIGAVRIGRIDGEFIIDPTFTEIEYSDLDLRMAGTRDAILMVECGAKEISEEEMVQALNFGHQALQPIIDIQEELREKIGKPKAIYPATIENEELIAAIRNEASPVILDILQKPYIKSERNAAFKQLELSLIEKFSSSFPASEVEIRSALEKCYKEIVRRRIIEEGIRADGRTLDEIRPIWCEVNVSPRAHGSGLFTRGETQVLTLATLGTPREAQEIDSLTPAESKRYMHHYNFPPFSTGEVKALRGASRREIGHGALAERALVPVIPPENKFPYTLRLVSEVLSSNGSSSMASVCGSTLALMDTGVPISAPVAGVAMGLVKEGERYAILTDILGLEDHFGDMDFKVAGTPKGITALQMDIKIKGISSELMLEALKKAKTARAFILEKMLEVIPEPRPELKPHAPRITVVQIPVDKIGAVIGPGGKTIRSIQEETNTKIDIGEDGSVFIAATDGESARIAVEKVENLTETPVVGRIYTGKVVRVADFGAFVEILPNVDGLVHISQLDSARVNKVEDIVRVGDEITVMVTDIDSQGKIRLSRAAVLEGWSAEEAQSRDQRGGTARQSGGFRPQSSGKKDDKRSGGHPRR